MTKLLYGEGYRLAKNAWKKLKKGDFYNPATERGKIDGSKALIFHNSDDTVIDVRSVKKFSKDTGAKLVVRKKGGHNGLSEVMEPATWREVVKFLKK